MLNFIIEDQDVLWIDGDKEDLLLFAKQLEPFVASGQTPVTVEGLGHHDSVYKEHVMKDLMKIDRMVFHRDDQFTEDNAQYLIDGESKTINFFGPIVAIQSLKKGLELVGLSKDPLEHCHVYDYYGGPPYFKSLIVKITISSAIDFRQE